ncbi:MAG: aminopeptidase P N-terminal domain-containing protein [Planctomycetes bacterium]|nr:aminopeptidase P N-terminal domain-containing protein [Planctomycetota bacterium]
MNCRSAVFLVVGALVAQTPSTLVPPLAPLAPAHFAQSRTALRAAIAADLPAGTRWVALVRGAGKSLDMGPFAQDQDFYWLSGVEEPELALLLTDTVDELLVPPFSRFAATWDGEFLAPGDATAQRTGFSTAGNVRSLATRLEELLAPGGDGKRPILLTPKSGAAPRGSTPGHTGGVVAAMTADKFDGRKSREAALADALASKYEGLEIRDLTPFVHALRARKAPAELTALRASAAIAAEGHIEAMRSARPGLYEFQIAAIARYVFSLRGAGTDAYGAIVGAAKNGCVLHYKKNSALVQDGDLIVMDYAATVRGYAADVTRTFPANGRFSPAQKKLVQDVYDIQQRLLADVKPGARLSALGSKCAALLAERGYRSDHGPCHHIGLAVHDPSVDVLSPGMVISVEPGAYLRKEGMGCRIEDTILITDSGYENLSAAAPSAPDAIEALMVERGVVEVPVGSAK